MEFKKTPATELEKVINIYNPAVINMGIILSVQTMLIFFPNELINSYEILEYYNAFSKRVR